MAGPWQPGELWAALGDTVSPTRLSRSPRLREERKLTTYSNSKQLGDQSSLEKDQTISDDVGGPKNPELVGDDGVSAEWITGQITNLLLSDAPPPPPPPPSGLEKLEVEASRLRAVVYPPAPGFVKEYKEGVRGAELVVASVGIVEVEARERALELERLEQSREETNIYRAREANLLYREDRARRRVLELKANAKKRVGVEKQAIIEISIARERALAPAFARARRGLEAAISAQAGRVREVFGELRPGEIPGARRFRVDWRGVPQPVEIRIHCIRAVRDRLPRGSYVLLSSMAERLGGRVMRWTKGYDFYDVDDNDSIDTDGGDSRPAATIPVQHGGRYFDRELRFDQNVYQLCPGKSDVRPGNVMVFELFRLAGSSGSGGCEGGHGNIRHKGGELEEDMAVGWCVLPLTDSRLRVVRGSFRIPMLRGEPNPNIDLHEGLENLIAADLEAWLGNLYIDIRQLHREARVEGSGIEGGSSIGGEGFDIEYDHVRKLVRLGKGLCGNKKSSDGWWQGGRSNRDNDVDNEGTLDALESYKDIETGGDETGTDKKTPENTIDDVDTLAPAEKPDETSATGAALQQENMALTQSGLEITTNEEAEETLESSTIQKPKWSFFKSKKKSSLGTTIDSGKQVRGQILGRSSESSPPAISRGLRYRRMDLLDTCSHGRLHALISKDIADLHVIFSAPHITTLDLDLLSKCVEKRRTNPSVTYISYIL